MHLTDVGLFSHLIASFAFAALTIAAWLRRRRDGSSWWLVAAAATTTAWAVVFVAAARGTGNSGWLLSLFETLRSASWVAFVLSLLRAAWRLEDRRRSSFMLAGSIALVTGAQLLVDGLQGAGYGVLTGGHAAPIAVLFVVGRLVVAIFGLVLLHNLYVNAAPLSRGGIRLLCIGLGGFFGYDLNLFTLQFLFGEMSSDLFDIRGAVDAIVVPLLLLGASSTWAGRVQVSRQVVFHTMSFSIIGIYLIVMALAAYGLSLVGGNWGRLLQISFLFATAILGVVVMVSPRFRAVLRVSIAKNFFAYKYDYRQEWLRFIATVSQTGADSGELSERVVQAVCAVVDSPGGAYFAPNDDGGFDLVGRWNLRKFDGVAITASSGIGDYLRTRQRIVDFDEWRAGEGDYGGMTLPEWAAGDRRVWLAMPLLHLSSLCGFILIERSVAPRDLNWEDYDLLRTLGRQAASYIAEASTQATLDEAGAFDDFNRRFAFIMHDIKNLVSQLSLVARNAERHADNPAFRADMALTLQASVGKMNDLLARLAQRNTGRVEEPRAVDVGELLGQVVTSKRRIHEALHLVADGGSAAVAADPGRLEQLFVHLIQNAIDATTGDATTGDATTGDATTGDATTGDATTGDATTGDATTGDARIEVAMTSVDGEVVVTISDRGCGMSAAFIRAELYKPFRSTKPGGFGIGAYEAREIARGIGGRLDVVSRPGEGTVFTITLPMHLTPQGGVEPEPSSHEKERA